MATISNVQEDELQPTALEKQVQVLTAAIECLTKQNQALEEQLYRKANNNMAEYLEILMLSSEITKDQKEVTPQTDWSGET